MTNYQKLKQIIQEANQLFDDEVCPSCFKPRERPIRLADCILATNLDEIDGGKDDIKSSTIYTLCLMWNKYDDNLDHQSDETKKFLIKLLGK